VGFLDTIPTYRLAGLPGDKAEADQIDALVKAQALPVGSLVILAIGFVAGFLGNLLSL
jgi:hypothetical protein